MNYEHGKFLAIIKSFCEFPRNWFLKSALNSMLMFETWITDLPMDLGDKWEQIFNFISNFANSNHFKDSKKAEESLKGVMAAIRNIYIAGLYNGDVTNLFDIYFQVKNTINDIVFDSLYIDYLIRSYVKENLNGIDRKSVV